MRTFDKRNEANSQHTISSNSIATINRATDRPGPGQALAMAIITTGEQLRTRGCSATIRWTPARKGIEGNEVANNLAKAAAVSTIYATDRKYLRETGFAHLSRKTTEKRSEATKDWTCGTSSESDDIALREEARSAPTFERKRRNWIAGSISPFPATQQLGPTSRA